MILTYLVVSVSAFLKKVKFEQNKNPYGEVKMICFVLRFITERRFGAPPHFSGYPWRGGSTDHRTSSQGWGKP